MCGGGGIKRWFGMWGVALSAVVKVNRLHLHAAWIKIRVENPSWILELLISDSQGSNAGKMAF